jgi:osmotically-inducible protein OsmY
MYDTLTKSDVQIQQDVYRELRWDSRIGQTEVGVEVDKGVVTLTGTVSSYAKKYAANEAAHRVTGVLDVANQLEVRYPGSASKTDTEVAQAVRHALEWDAFVPDQKIRSTVTGGWVTLEGEVEFVQEQKDAERAVRALTGVKGVFNRILVKSKKVDPAEVRKAIEQALERRAEREAERIQVEVQDGTVTLSGRVHNWFEKDSILGSAAHASGVMKVNDRLRVEPYF